MATWYERDRVTKTHEVVVPMIGGYADHAQLLQGIYAARRAAAQAAGLPDDRGLSDTAVLARVTDDEIVLYFDTEIKEP